MWAQEPEGTAAGVPVAQALQRDANVAMLTKIEHVDGRDVRRTGWTSSARRCPVHGDALELCFDETDYAKWTAGHQRPFNHDDNRVGWRCARCVGRWLENRFLDDPPTSAEAVAAVVCPSCHRDRVVTVGERNECESCGALVAVRLVSRSAPT